MKKRTARIFAGVLAAAFCAGPAAPARALLADAELQLRSAAKSGALPDVPAAPAAADGPWAFFDLGKTLISHSPQYTDMKYIPHVPAYLQSLRDRGFHLGILLNWPAGEGRDDREKLLLLKRFVARGWAGPEPFNWDIFELIAFPPVNEAYKPAPYLFKEAVKKAGACNAVYQGEDAREIEAAAAAGLPARRVVFFPEPPAQYQGFLTPDEILAGLKKCSQDGSGK